MTDLLTLAAVFAIPVALVLTAWLAWKAGQATADRPPTLVPVDDDTVIESTHYVWLVEVQFDASGNYDQYVVADRSDDGLSKSELREVIHDRIPGTIVRQMEQYRLYAPGPGAEASAVEADD